MPLYECVFIARNDITQQQVEAIAEQVTALIAEGGGEAHARAVDVVGKKAREIEHGMQSIDALPV